MKRTLRKKNYNKKNTQKFKKQRKYSHKHRKNIKKYTGGSDRQTAIRRIKQARNQARKQINDAKKKFKDAKTKHNQNIERSRAKHKIQQASQKKPQAPLLKFPVAPTSSIITQSLEFPVAPTSSITIPYGGLPPDNNEPVTVERRNYTLPGKITNNNENLLSKEFNNT